MSSPSATTAADVTAQVRGPREPLEVVVDLVQAVSPGLDAGTIRKITGGVAAGPTKSRRLAAALQQNPDLLMHGRSPAPLVVGELLVALNAAGAVNVARPRCAGCGGPIANTMARRGQDWYCHSCGIRREPCVRCAKTRAVSTRDEQGRARCWACPPQDIRDPTQAITQTVRHVDPTIDPEQIRAAVQAIAPTTARQRKLARALTDQPSLLTGDGTHAPASSVLRLIDVLAADASSGLVRPGCPGCGQTVALVARRNGLWSCRVCVMQARAVGCVRCGAVRPPAMRDSDGDPICRQCRRRDCDTQPTCVGCQRRRPIAARGPDGPRCQSCHPRPARVCSICGKTTPCQVSTVTGLPHCATCARWWAPCSRCRRVRQVRGGTKTQPLCATCTQPDPARWRPCPGCGEQTVTGNGCTRCTLRRHLQDLLQDDAGQLRPELQVLLDTLAGHERPITVLNWLRNSSATPILKDLATGRLPLTHQGLDQLPASKVLTHLRAVLVSTTALPARDEQMARLQRWLAATIAARPDPDQRHLLHRYGDWYLLRRLRERTRRRATGYHQVVAVQQRIRFAVAFLDALHERGLTLATATQPDLEAWLTSDQATGRHELGAFIRWAAAHQLTALTMPSTTWAGPGAAIHAQERWDQARRLLHDDTLKAADRLAGLLVLLYAQRAASIARLTRPGRRRRPGNFALAVPRWPTRRTDQRPPARQAAQGRRHPALAGPQRRALRPGHRPARRPAGPHARHQHRRRRHLAARHRRRLDHLCRRHRPPHASLRHG
jgi:hypothetical protein